MCMSEYVRRYRPLSTANMRISAIGQNGSMADLFIEKFLSKDSRKQNISFWYNILVFNKMLFMFSKLTEFSHGKIEIFWFL